MASSVNSFRAFKLKLPKKECNQERVDDAHKTPTKRRPVSPIRITSGYSTGVSGRESRSSFDAKIEQFGIKCEKEDFYTRSGVSPMSAYLPRIFAHSTTGKLDVPWHDRLAGFLPSPHFVANDPLSRMRLSNPIYMPPTAQDLPFLPNLLYQSLRPDPERHEASSEILPQDVGLSYSPKREKLNKSSSLDSSPVSSDAESSHKCSSSPGSSDSGYTGSTDTSSLMNESDIDPKVLDAEKKEGCFKCNFCKRTFSYLCHLKVHERVHTGEKPYSCKYCSQQFSQLGSLTVHMRIHTGAKPYQCDECSKRFRHVNSLRRHQRQVHNMTSTQIAASVDKCKEESGQTKHPDYPSQGQSNGHQNKRKREHSSQENSFTRSAYYRTQNDCSLGTRNKIPFESMVQCKKESLEPHSSTTYKSKFICELENRAKQRQDDHGVRNLGTSRTSVERGAKSSSKTWRPFLVDEEEKPSVPCPTYDPISPAVVNRTSESELVVSQPWSAGFSNQQYVTKSGLDSNNFMMTHSLQDGNDEQRKLETSQIALWRKFRNNNMQAIQQNLNPSCMWLSPLSLRSSPVVRMNKSENKQVGRESPDRCPQRDPNTDSKSPCEDGVKMEKEYNSTDEGFSSSCSTGTKSPGSPNSCFNKSHVPGNFGVSPTKKIHVAQEAMHVVKNGDSLVQKETEYIRQTCKFEVEK